MRVGQGWGRELLKQKCVHGGGNGLLISSSPDQFYLFLKHPSPPPCPPTSPSPEQLKL